MGLREDVLRELVTEYQKDRSPIVFERILKRVDHLLLKTIHIQTEIRPYLGCIDLRDLYHTAIVGLGRALHTTRPQEDGGHVAARIIAYVRNQINVDYPPRRRSRFILSDDDMEDRSVCFPSQDIESKLELEDIVKKCCGFLADNVIDLFVEKFVRGKNAYQIAREQGCTPQNIDQKLKYWLRRIKKVMDENGTSD